MNKIMKIALTVCLLHALFSTVPAQAATTEVQDYPNKLIRIIVGFVPGAGVDLTARLVAQKLQETFGQSVIVENRAGAGGNLAAEIVAHSKPDGYTLLLSSPGPIVVNQSLMDNLPYDPIKDLAPITTVASGPNILVVRLDLPANNVKELITLARTTPKLLSFGTSGMGSTPHMAAELLKMMAKVDMVHVAYKGSGPAMLDLMAGRIDLMITTAPACLSQVKAGKVRALGVTTLRRFPELPDVPTIDEAGLSGYEFGVWWALFAPAATPAAIIDKLHRTVVNIVQMADVRSRLAVHGAVAQGSTTPKELAEAIQKEAVKWADVIKTAGIKVK